MRKSIRRSLIVAAAASGMWALGTAGANAAELPVSSDTVTGAVEKADEGGVPDTVEDVTGTVRETTEGVTQTVIGKLPTHGIPENGLPTNTLPTGQLPTGALPTDNVGGVVGDARGQAGKVTDTTGRASKAVKEAQLGLSSVTPDVPATPGIVDGLPIHGIEAPLPPRTLPMPQVPSVPQVPGVPSVPSALASGDFAGGLAAAGVRPEQATGVLQGDHAQHALSMVRTAVSTAEPHLVPVTVAVLPPFANRMIVQAEPMAYEAASRTAVTVDDATATSAPFAESTANRTQALAQNATGELNSFGQGVGSQAVPFAQELSSGACDNGYGLAGHALTVTQIVSVPSHRDLTDAANIPGLPATSQLPSVPAV
jgi:hypothetical protein